MSRGRWVVAALVLALTGCESGQPVSDSGPDPTGETRTPIVGPSGVPWPGSEAQTPGADTQPPRSRAPAPGGNGSGSPRAPVLPTPRVHATDQAVCDDAGAGRALGLSTADPAATGLLDEWDACLRMDTTPAYTWLHNRTHAVWVLRTTPWDVVQEHRPARTRLGTLQSGVFHRAAEERGKPGNASAFIHPGESLWIAAEPDTVSWQVDLPLTVAWAGAGEIVRRLDDHGRQLLTEAITGRDAGPSATVTCVLALGDYARNRTDLYQADLKDMLRDGFEDMIAADDCHELARETVIGRRGRTISVLEDVLEVIPGSESTMERLSNDLEPYAGVTGAITLQPVGPDPG
jgi:hypothetical protein